jgi:hypothetical protein
MIWREPWRWANLDPFAESIGFSAGIVLADDFDTILRHLSAQYLLEAWHTALAVLERFDLTQGPLWWTAMNAGETVRDPPPHAGFVPTDFIGWSSPTLENLWVNQRWPAVDQALSSRTPRLALLANREAWTWRISPEDTTRGLRFVVAMAIDDYTNWAPDWVLREHAAQVHEEPWLRVAQAMARWDQDALDAACAAAHTAYSPIGYRMLLEGFGAYLTEWKLPIELPPIAEDETNSW